MMVRVLHKAAVLFLSFWVTSAWAQDWEFRLTPYLWFAGLKGDVGAFPGLPSAPVDISPKDALEDTEAGIMVLFDAKKMRHGLFLDFIYTDVQSNEELIPEVDLRAKSKTKSTIFSAAYEYELYRDGGAVVDALAGVRYWRVDSEFNFRGGLGLLDGRTISHDESWVDPAIAVKGRTFIGDSRFYVAGGLTIGGFGVGSDFFYDLNTAIGYQWNEAIGTAIGYRLFDVDYEDGGFLFDVRQQGLQMGLTWSF